MPSSLFPAQNPSNVIGFLKQVVGRNPTAMYNQLKASNPQFAQFANLCESRGVEAVAKEHGLNLDEIRRFM